MRPEDLLQLKQIFKICNNKEIGCHTYDLYMYMYICRLLSLMLIKMTLVFKWKSVTQCLQLRIWSVKYDLILKVIVSWVKVQMQPDVCSFLFTDEFYFWSFHGRRSQIRAFSFNPFRCFRALQLFYWVSAPDLWRAFFTEIWGPAWQHQWGH